MNEPHRLLIDGVLIELTREQFEALGAGHYNEPALALPSFERRILWRVCENGKSPSSTWIAAEEWQGERENYLVNQRTVEMALESLNEQGLVIYSLSERGMGDRQFINIRATRAGYDTAGFPPPVALIQGSRRFYSDDAPKHPGDHTDFRVLLDIAIGGPIERCSLTEHLRQYPDHAAIHPSMEELRMTRDTIADAANGIRHEQDSIVDMTIEQIMRERGVSKYSAYTLRREASADIKSQGASESLKEQIHALITARGPIKDVETIKAYLSEKHQVTSNYDISRALWSLKKSGDITFYERKSGKDSILSAIKLTRGVTAKPMRNGASKGHHPVGKDMTDPRNHPIITEGGPVVSNATSQPAPEVVPTPVYVPPVVEEPVLPRYAKPEPPAQNMKPVTDEESETPQKPIRSTDADMGSHTQGSSSDTHTQYRDGDVDKTKFPRIADLMTKEARLAAYEAAAQLLEETDAEMALALLEKIQLTDLEKEVIRFVRRD